VRPVAKKRKGTPTGFGERLKTLRAAADMTQTELGVMCGMTYQAIARLERAENEPNWPTVLKLAKALGVEPNDFLNSQK
jgi:transcriptional regulator with XRE-family HTH domain